MLHLVLHQPEIPSNTGSVIRLCANTGMTLHLVGPLGFVWDDRRLRRAGLDYHELARVRRYDSYDGFCQQHAEARVMAFSTRGQTLYTEVAYRPGDWLLFGAETRGLPDSVLASVPPQRQLRLPMVPGSRSLNLANAVAVAVFEAWRQLGFEGASTSGGPR